jgi:hypothetical protein
MKVLFLFSFLFFSNHLFAGNVIYTDVGLFKIENRAYFLSDLKFDVELFLRMHRSIVESKELSGDWLNVLGLRSSYLLELQNINEKQFPLDAALRLKLLNFVNIVKLMEFVKSQDLEINKKTQDFLEAQLSSKEKLNPKFLKEMKIIWSLGLYFDLPRFRESMQTFADSELLKWQSDKKISSKEQAIKSIRSFKRQEALKQFLETIGNQYTHEFI